MNCAQASFNYTDSKGRKPDCQGGLQEPQLRKARAHALASAIDTHNSSRISTESSE
ncbi:MAG: hypothetical protein ACR2MG_00400 [Pyrinomonadaceae bacterium]